MIGIHVYTSELPNYEDNHTNITKAIDKYKFTISFHNQYDKEVFYETDEYLIFLDGWIFSSENYKTQAKEILSSYIKNKEDFIFDINGQFNILIVNKVNFTFSIWNDIFSFRKHYYTFGNNLISISSDIEFITKITSQKTLNFIHIQKNIDLPRFIDIEETFIKEVKQFKPYSVIDSFKTIKNYSYEKVEELYKDLSTINPETFLFKIKKKIQKIHNKDKVLLLLSGGLDSRFVLEIFKDINLDVETATFGNKFSDEVKIAEEVAKRNVVKHTTFHLNSKQFLLNSKKYIKQVGGLDIFVQSPVYQFYENFEKNNFIIDTGFALDMFLGGTQIDVNKGHDFAIFNRVFSTLAIRQSAHREFYEDRYSMYNYEIYFMMKNLPSELIKDYKFYQKLCNLQIKNSFDIPLQSTMFDLTLDVEFWKETEAIQFEKEKFVLKYFNETGKVLYHNRYYSDFDMWLRAEKEWIELVNKLFIDNESLLSKYFIKNEIIQQTIQEHMHAEKSHLRNIVKWISLEIFLIENRIEYEL
jgi:hypothetical protein